MEKPQQTRVARLRYPSIDCLINSTKSPTTLIVFQRSYEPPRKAETSHRGFYSYWLPVVTAGMFLRIRLWTLVPEEEQGWRHGSSTETRSWPSVDQTASGTLSETTSLTFQGQYLDRIGMFDSKSVSRAAAMYD